MNDAIIRENNDAKNILVFESFVQSIVLSSVAISWMSNKQQSQIALAKIYVFENNV
jgi:hypothetical protein